MVVAKSDGREGYLKVIGNDTYVLLCSELEVGAPPMSNQYCNQRHSNKCVSMECHGNTTRVSQLNQMQLAQRAAARSSRQDGEVEVAGPSGDPGFGGTK